MPPPAWFDRDHDGPADTSDSSSESEDESQADDVTFYPGEIGTGSDTDGDDILATALTQRSQRRRPGSIVPAPVQHGSDGEAQDRGSVSSASGLDFDIVFGSGGAGSSDGGAMFEQ